MTRRRPVDTDRQAIGAAECAARTGLSTRALRVYEQQRLVTPARSANGWRTYVASDLARLNTIRVLKNLGLSLAQIRGVLTARSPSLEEVLQVQAIAWKARKHAAEKAIELVSGALSHLREHKSLSMDALCELVRMYGLNPVVPNQDELLARDFPAHNSRLWSAWWAEHPDELAESARFNEAQLALFHELKSLQESGQEAGSARVQRLMRHWEALFLSHHVRERTVRQLDWNYDVTFNWFELVHKNRTHQYAPREGGTDAALYTLRFASFLGAAHQKSAHGKALATIAHRISEALAARVSPRSVPGRALAQLFAATCKTHSLGDPLTYARFALFIEQINHGRDAPAQSAPWRYLLEALAGPSQKRKAAAAATGRRLSRSTQRPA